MTLLSIIFTNQNFLRLFESQASDSEEIEFLDEIDLNVRKTFQKIVITLSKQLQLNE